MTTAFHQSWRLLTTAQSLHRLMHSHTDVRTHVTLNIRRSLFIWTVHIKEAIYIFIFRLKGILRHAASAWRCVHMMEAASRHSQFPVKHHPTPSSHIPPWSSTHFVCLTRSSYRKKKWKPETKKAQLSNRACSPCDLRKWNGGGGLHLILIEKECLTNAPSIHGHLV